MPRSQRSGVTHRGDYGARSAYARTDGICHGVMTLNQALSLSCAGLGTAGAQQSGGRASLAPAYGAAYSCVVTALTSV